jgi:hypothetical protein
MDAVKKAFVKEIHDAVEKLVEQGLPAIANMYDNQVTFEFHEVTALEFQVRIGQGPYRGPRYLSVIVKERI